MSRYNPKVFTNVDVLGGLDAELLIQLFRKFPKFFEEHEIHLENGTLNFENITKALIRPNDNVQDSDETHELMEALQLITEMSSQEVMDSLISAAKDQGIELHYTPGSHEDLALFCFLNQPDLFHTEYARSLVRNYRGFSFYWGSHTQKRSFPEISDGTITALQSELDDWFASNNRLRNCRVYLFPQGHRVSIVIKYGKPLKREFKMKDGETGSVFYNPQCHDLLIYNCDSDDVSVRISSKKKGQIEEFLRCVGKHIFGNEEYFSEQKKFSLEKLRDVDNAAHSFATTDGVEDVKLVEIHYDWGGETEIRKSGNLLNTLIRKNGQESTKRAAINFAKFSVKFEGVKKARPIDIRAGNRATFSRDEDFLVVEDWITDQGLVEPRTSKQEAAQYVEYAREAASA